MDAGGGGMGGCGCMRAGGIDGEKKRREDDEEVRGFFFLYAWSLAAAAFPLGLWFAG